MKQLFWKEWHELRLLPSLAVTCMIVLVFGAKAYAQATGDPHPFALDNIVLPLQMTWGAFSIAAGAGLFAQEVGSGGLTFLSVLPISRRRLWWIKMGAATTALFLSLLAIGAALILPLMILLPGTRIADFWKPYSTESGLVDTLILLDIFAMSVAVSPFFDRPVSAFIAAALASGVAYGALAAAVNVYLVRHLQQYEVHINAHHVLIPARYDFDSLVLVAVALPVPVLLAISYWAFTRGESLRSPKRFRVGAFAALASLSVAGLVLGMGHWASLW